jgi:extradiol dioxygenase family protein
MDTLFHLSLPCNNINETKSFYKDIVGAELGRQTNNWIDVNLYGHQITFTQAGRFNFNNPNYVFEGKILPSFHFGIILGKEKFKHIHSKLSDMKLDLVNQSTFLKNKPGEHISFFVKDPNHYMLEFKYFKEADSVFKKK